jgi:hypothetical protein
MLKLTMVLLLHVLWYQANVLEMVGAVAQLLYHSNGEFKP